MPLTHTTAKDPGDFDTGTYAKMKIIRFTMDLKEKFIELTCENGNVVNDEWVSAKIGHPKTVIITDHPDTDPPGTNYTDFVTTNATLYNDVASALYNWMLSNDAETDGTIDT